MSQSVIPHIVAALLCAIVAAPLTGCGKKLTASTGDTASTSKGKSAAAPVETITPDKMVTVPEEKSGESTIETAREPMEVPPASSGAPDSGGGAISAAPETIPEASSQAVPPATPPAAFSSPSGGTPSVDTLTLGDIFFDFDQHTIRMDAQTTLSANAAWISSRPGKAVLIEGHCDERGTQAYNLVLGEKRARSVKRYLEDLGVPASRLKTTSYGEMRPFCKQREESCYQQNRRAHFVAQ
ncbi:MAG TPA: peptidoglycan-associated lipoprotein Pal [Nitrospira sp.]|nr:peptidoglycan-associated lipoprotein Pal [Nitrospira sp.]